MSDPEPPTATVKSQTQEEHVLISTSLEVEKLDTFLFRSPVSALYKPRRARGVFGGQVVSQAVMSATRSVNERYMLHSLHCYFLLSASTQIPILYHVEVLRTGRTYSTCSIKAVQDGRTIFMMLCSFAVPEPRIWSHAIKVPADVPPPEELEDEEQMLGGLLEGTRDERVRRRIEEQIMDRKHSPIGMKHVPTRTNEDGTKIYMIWMKAKSIPKYPPAYQKCILSYISDHWFVHSVSRQLGYSFSHKPPHPLGISMQQSLDHSLYFYSHEFDAGDWMLYVTMCPRAEAGRGFVHGRVYDRKGVLCAMAGQEGLIRTNDMMVEGKGKGEKSKL